MFSVLHVCTTNDSVLRIADCVVHHAKYPDGSKELPCVSLHGTGEGDGTFWVWDGTVFVMNDNGKTVATYHLPSDA
jgi:hypothetical protein